MGVNQRRIFPIFCYSCCHHKGKETSEKITHEILLMCVAVILTRRYESPVSRDDYIRHLLISILHTYDSYITADHLTTAAAKIWGIFQPLPW